MRIFFSVGEPSGDQHAAHLIREMQQRRPDIECCGFGGPLMRAAGCDVQFQLTDLAVMGFFRILPMLGQFWQVYQQAKKLFAAQQPDALVLVDFPGFNWWMARAAKKQGIPVFYYLPPQLWAWAPWRVRRMKRLVDHVMSGLPFERDWYHEHGVDVEFVGHPFFDEVAEHTLDQGFMGEWSAGESVSGEPVINIGMLPGSRRHEVQRNWPVMVETMRELAEQFPNVRFLVACYKPEHESECRKVVDEFAPEAPVHFFVGRTPEIIEASRFCFMVSGSVSLEMLARRTPAVVLFRVGRLARMFGYLILNCDYISLPNLIAEDEVIPEFISYGNPEKDQSAILEIFVSWLRDPQQLQQRIDWMESICTDVVKTGATDRAATYLLGELSNESAQKRAA